VNEKPALKTLILHLIKIEASNTRLKLIEEYVSQVDKADTETSLAQLDSPAG